jgi:predicted unusual protein kinase regulating ubiquinone biosynthesis (AarF/ABC1/UbiB family)
MYRRVHNTHELNTITTRKSNDNDNDSDIDTDIDNDTHNKENSNNTSNNKSLYKINNFFTTCIPIIKNGLSNTYFISSCLAIYTKYFLIYNLSKKTKVDYNYMVKNIVSKLSSKNVFFTKIFQAVSNNNNILDKELFNYFIEYTDSVKYDSSEIDYNGLYDLINIARANGDELSIDSEEPIKSGNIALVYKGKLSGKSVIIKYRRKNIVEKFKRSMDELFLLISISKKLPYICDLNMSDLFEENREIMLNQLNFNNEVSNIQLFSDKFKDMSSITIPTVYPYFTENNPCAIVMDFIDGKRIEEISDHNKDEYSRILSRFNLKCVFYDAIYHADMHSGNVIFLKETNNENNTEVLKIGIIDYGIIGTMTRTEQNIFFTFFKILVSKNCNELASYIVDNLSEHIEFNENKLNEEDRNTIVENISSICNKTINVNNKMMGGEEIVLINKVLKKQNLQFSKFFCRVELAIAISENVCNSLASNSSYIEQLSSAFDELFGNNVDDYF